MKRHESIVTLSKDHHFGLLFCWKIRQGVKRQVPPDRILPYIEYFWSNHLQPHFEAEETLPFAAVQDDLVDRAIADHKHIEQLVKTITSVEPVVLAQLNTLADALDSHIRFEERVLFPHLEKALSSEKLAWLGAQLQQIHSINEKDNYPDEFWMKEA